MEQSAKLEPIAWGKIAALIIVVGIIISSFFLALGYVLEESDKHKIEGLIFCGFGLFNLALWIKDRDLKSLTLMVIALTMSLSYLLGDKAAPLSGALVVMYAVYGILLYRNMKINARFRRILELAARTVTTSHDGFTPRPLPAGSAPVSRDELIGFARFLKKNGIAFPYSDETGVMLALKDQSSFLFGRPRENRDSYVAIGFDGRVTVNLARKDYRKFKEELTFDRLCRSLGDVFKMFLIQYRKGEGRKIIASLQEEG